MLSIIATDLPRFMACNGSRLMEGFTPSVDADDSVRNEGNAADWLIQKIFKDELNFETALNQKASNGIYIDNDMIEHVTDYVTRIKGKGDVEVVTNYSAQNGDWEIRGRADHIYFDGTTLFVDDFKYGWGIVEPFENWTLISHAVGWLMNNPQSNVQHITMTIFQPRPYHADGTIRSWPIPYENFAREYGDKIFQTMHHPTDQLNTSGHCYKCPAMVNCPAYRRAALNAIDVSELAYKDAIDNDVLSESLDNYKRAIDILNQGYKAYSELALDRVKKGQIVNNYGTENELTNRNWKPFVTPDLATIMTGKDLTKKQLITPAQAIKAGVPEETVTALCERHNKGVKLVRIDQNTKAKKLFN